ncbi:MarR family winged helix-turn-helix transcriptional regulator [Acinetobacter rathckeae]|uniref:MarR family winged helix-turn-helix transcriptional regulator n=1 Tax=Acinetobacter rathckeae TaxID=2605272 RepID=UPI0018A30F96|nr:MarR family transcriptional regulator [Acinetobacter rathckeae]MBF7688552.1 MarR family transcriptional regulator [Acinetobacter rathckeae]MBF7695799.1 MarR family transcriptional regulator [Acinetobacter rathckeae]
MNQNTYVLDQQVGYLLRKAYQRHLAIFQQNIGSPQLTSVQFTVLYTVNLLGHCSQKELVESTAIDQATIRGIVERLIKRELLLQSQDAIDKRKVKIHITELGKITLAEATEKAQLISSKTLEILNPAEQLALLYLLKKLSE